MIPRNSISIQALAQNWPLFFGNTKLSDELDNSLTYTAPKQPKVKKEEDLTDANKRRPSTSVIIAKVVLLWKLEDKNYKGLGKHGLAVIGSTELNLFEIIAYKEKNNILLKIKICNTLMIYNKSENFSSFFDNENQNWLVKFDDYDSQNKFCEIIQKYGCKIQYDSNTPESANKRTENLLREKENIETEPLFVSNVAKSPEKRW
ncbi:hypothetical protein NQ317_016550 [Molorchus minor]|uniref:Uncharacterized protein n=1 Tax=Molorchus minor TaxID=1323400 RepID=A0ABQ9J828_9CUCU|nr:hypothetical protein NQ317_016550 [Molorchus minor]